MSARLPLYLVVGATSSPLVRKTQSKGPDDSFFPFPPVCRASFPAGEVSFGKGLGEKQNRVAERTRSASLSWEG